MILPVLTMLWLAGLALAAAVPMAIGSARQGRSHAREQAAAVAARAGLADAAAGGWVGAAALAPPGAVLALPPIGSGPVLVTRQVRRLGAGPLWLVLARAELRAPAGLLALSEQGLLLRLFWSPADSGYRVEPVTRAWFRRPE